MVRSAVRLSYPSVRPILANNFRTAGRKNFTFGGNFSFANADVSAVFWQKDQRSRSLVPNRPFAVNNPEMGFRSTD